MTKRSGLGSAVVTFLLVVSCTPSPPKGTITITTHIDFSALPYHGTPDTQPSTSVPSVTSKAPLLTHQLRAPYSRN